MSVLAGAKARDIELVDGLRSLGLSLSSAACAKLDAYVALLAKWNRTYNLTAIREPARMVTHHLLDALAVLPHLPQREFLRVLDVGAGAGVPGIPLGIARPHWSIVLVDSNQKKVAFLTQAAIELALPNVHVVIARAFADLRTFAQLSARHLSPSGRLYAMKGALPEEEISALPLSIEVVTAPALHVPGLDAERHLVVLRNRVAA
ncbi:MAG: 16S rRNA (guanine(527)-N(7))-methyltransferase RsmG [Betaproteobacteria bacterium]|nr:MAG: 16S rRNA (guanine(527)-N(7))-methyltransferase RsmG [Betaproteobacteria bacterium]